MASFLKRFDGGGGNGGKGSLYGRRRWRSTRQEENTAKKQPRTLLQRALSLNRDDAPTSSQASVLYVVDILKICMISLLVTVVILVLPLNDPADGWKQNIAYFFGYNGYVSLFLAYASWQRLSRLCVKRRVVDADAIVDHGDILNVGSKLDDVGLMSKLLLISAIGCPVMFLIPGVFWDKNLGSSYIMLYIAPLATGLFDNLFFLLLPREEWTFNTFKLINAYNFILGTLIFICFTVIVLQLATPAGLFEVVIPLVCVGIKKGSRKCGETIIDKLSEACGYDGRCFDSGISLYYYGMWAVCYSMLMSRAQTPLILFYVCATRVGTSCFNVMYSRYLFSQVETEEKGEDLEEPKEPEQLKELSVKKSKFGVAEYFRQQGMQHITDLMAPMLFIVASTIIFFYDNKDKYYMLECFDLDAWSKPVTYVAIQLMVVIVSIVLEMEYYACAYGEDVYHLAIKIMDLNLNKQWKHTFPCMVALSCLFTSCFFLKHDGIAALGQLGQGIGECQGNSTVVELW